MTDVDILYEGDSIVSVVESSSAEFISRADGQPGTCAFRVKDTSHDYAPGFFHLGGTLELYVDGTREWDGWVIDATDEYALAVSDTSTPSETARYWSISGMDRNLLFTKRILFDQAEPANTAGFKVWPAGTYDQEAIYYALEHYVDLSGDGLDYSIQSIAPVDEDAEFKLGAVAQPLQELFRDAQKMTGGVYFISPDRTLQYVGDMEVTAPWVITDVPQWYDEGEAIGCRELKFTWSIEQMGNHAMVWGAGRGSDEPVFEEYKNQDSIDSFGLWQWGDLFVNAYKPGTVLRRARTYVEGSPSHRVGHGVEDPTVFATIFEQGLRAGMVAEVDSYLLGYEVLPVRRVRITFPTKVDVRWQLEMSRMVDEPWSAYDLWEDPDQWFTEIIGTPPPLQPRWIFLDSFDVREGTSQDDFGRADNDRYWEDRYWFYPGGGGT